MPKQPEALWISPNPFVKCFDTPLIRYLARHIKLAHWEYQQTSDEPSSLELALTLLHDYLKSKAQPLHLLGHSTGGLLGLLYARQYPERIKSLTLLGVGVYPAIDWHVHYYALLGLLPCDRQIILAQIVRMLFGSQPVYPTQGLIEILEQDLSLSLSPHSLYQHHSIAPSSVPVPLLVCGSEDDIIIDRNALRGWRPWLKPEDCLWESPKGRHYFHYFYPAP
ncbi:MAG: alpha/beta hydrolase [Chloroflexaceae bacterium]|nr:alpha/beta hydrolase [Chloroflexaceae bacterium]